MELAYSSEVQSFTLIFMLEHGSMREGGKEKGRKKKRKEWRKEGRKGEGVRERETKEGRKKKKESIFLKSKYVSRRTERKLESICTLMLRIALFTQ